MRWQLMIVRARRVLTARKQASSGPLKLDAASPDYTGVVCKISERRVKIRTQGTRKEWWYDFAAVRLVPRRHGAKGEEASMVHSGNHTNHTSHKEINHFRERTAAHEKVAELERCSARSALLETGIRAWRCVTQVWSSVHSCRPHLNLTLTLPQVWSSVHSSRPHLPDGTRVRRGPSWEWAEQDGGIGSTGLTSARRLKKCRTPTIQISKIFSPWIWIQTPTATFFQKYAQRKCMKKFKTKSRFCPVH